MMLTISMNPFSNGCAHMASLISGKEICEKSRIEKNSKKKLFFGFLRIPVNKSFKRL